MSERYTKVFTTGENLYVQGAPVVIRAGALLKDQETGRLLAQLKLRNIGGKQISYVKVTIGPADAVGTALGDVLSFEYLDLAVADKEDFGTKKPLPLPNTSTRAFCVGVSTVGFKDGTVWTGDNTDWKSAEDAAKMSKTFGVEEAFEKACTLVEGNKSLTDIKQAKEIFSSIKNDMDVSKNLILCDELISQWDSKNKTTKKKIFKFSIIAAAAIVVFVILNILVFKPMKAVKNGDYKYYINMYNVKNFKIPEGVTGIYYEGFSGCDSLKSVTIPDSVTYIGDNAFNGCTSLESIDIPYGVTYIGYDAFRNCSSLKSITIPGSVGRINHSAFSNCTGLEIVTIQEGIEIIGDIAFAECSNLETIVIPDGVTVIGVEAFRNCTNLKQVYLPKTINTIYEEVFENCVNLRDVTFEGSKREWYLTTRVMSDQCYGYDNVTVHCTDGDVSFFR